MGEGVTITLFDKRISKSGLQPASILEVALDVAKGMFHTGFTPGIHCRSISFLVLGFQLLFYLLIMQTDDFTTLCGFCAAPIMPTMMTKIPITDQVMPLAT
jgi:hypothetical protein